MNLPEWLVEEMAAVGMLVIKQGIANNTYHVSDDGEEVIVTQQELIEMFTPVEEEEYKARPDDRCLEWCKTENDWVVS